MIQFEFRTVAITIMPVLLLVTTLWGAPPMTLTSQEKRIVESAREPTQIIAREHIVLAWPQGFQPQWYGESGVTNPDTMADWLETAYRFNAKWTRFDPNQHYSMQTGEYVRLVFVHDGSRDFQFGSSRPHIGLRDLKDPMAGSEDWFGWLAHELTHDFWHEHPKFQYFKTPWGEAMCDYERYALILNMGMPRAAVNWEHKLEQASSDDRYKGGAWIILSLQRRMVPDGPPALWNYLWDKDLNKVLGVPHWKN